MISFFSVWAQGIIVAIIITVIIEMLLPEGGSKKYLKIILGLYVLYTILNPILSKFSSGISLNDTIDSEQYILGDTISVAKMDTQNSIETVYIENIKKEIKTYIETKGFEVINIELTIEKQDEKTYGIIKTIELSISPKDKNAINNIEPVSINFKEGEEKEIYLSVEEDIKYYLKNNYGVNMENIIINS